MWKMIHDKIKEASTEVLVKPRNKKNLGLTNGVRGH